MNRPAICILLISAMVAPLACRRVPPQTASLTCPAGWEEKPPPRGADLVYFAPFEGQEDGLREFVSLLTRHVGPVQNPAEMVDGYAHDLENTAKDFHLIRRDERELNGHVAQLLVFRTGDKTGGLITRAYYVYHDGWEYTIMCGAEVDSYPRYKERFEACAQSFRIEQP